MNLSLHTNDVRLQEHFKMAFLFGTTFCRLRHILTGDTYTLLELAANKITIHNEPFINIVLKPADAWPTYSTSYITHTVSSVSLRSTTARPTQPPGVCRVAVCRGACVLGFFMA